MEKQIKAIMICIRKEADKEAIVYFKNRRMKYWYKTMMTLENINKRPGLIFKKHAACREYDKKFRRVGEGYMLNHVKTAIENRYIYPKPRLIYFE